MIFNVSGSGGGAALNFRVVGGTTAPENPKENCIWVNTSTDITSYVFSATQPTGSAGMVWITTGTASSVEFNALKKNGIQVYPISAKQNVSGAWVDVTAESYQGGKWVDWVTYLFNNGDQCTDLTGGWTNDGYTWGGNSNIPDPTFYADRMELGYDSHVVTKNKIDLSNINTLELDYACTVAGSQTMFCITNYTELAPGPNWSTHPAYVYLEKTERGTLTLDVTAYSGKYNIAILNSSGKVTVYEVKGW